MNGRLKILSKAVLLDQYGRMTAVILISLSVLFLSNNLFIGEKYLFDIIDFNSLSRLSGIENLKIPFVIAVSLIVCLISVPAVIPLKFGKEIWFFENAKKNRLKVRKIFAFYKRGSFFKSIRLTFTLFFTKLLFFLLFILPGAALSGCLWYSLYRGISETMLILLCSGIALTLFCGLFFFFVFSQRYSLSYILFYENFSLKPREAIKLSCKITDDRCFELAKLKLSFFLWFLTCLLIIPAFYVYPYYKMTFAVKQVNILSGIIDSK